MAQGVALTVDCDASSFEESDFPRLIRLREALLNARTAICVERARLMTEYYRRFGFESSQPVLRQAKALAYVLDRLPPVIFDEELIVGSTTRHRLGALLYPEFQGLAIWPELPTVATRSHDPVALSEQEADLLATEVFPFWRDHTIHEHVRRDGDPLSLRLSDRFVFYILSKSNGLTHLIPNYATLVETGLEAVITAAAHSEQATEDAEAKEFHQGVQIACWGVIRFAQRYASACLEQAAECPPERAQELRQIASILRNVPAKPAKTFREALQSMWITHVALCQENSDLALCFGRLDQVLGGLYEEDLDSGRLQERQAGELLGAFFIKMGDHTPLMPGPGQDLFGGSATNQAVTIGGLKPDGEDGVNRLSYLILKMSALLALREPNLCARWHKGASNEYLQALIESIYETGASPALYNDEAIIEALTAHGLSTHDARDYGVIGCVEISSAGRTMGMTGAILLNLAAALELTLNNGRHPLSGLRVGPPTGALSEFGAFEDLFGAFSQQLDGLVALATDGNRRLAKAHAELHPTPLLSALIEGTASSGRDVTRGGASYNSSGVGVIGLADVADSLTALKQLVFDENRLSLAQVSAALAADFVGHEKTHAMLAKRAAKYGNDNPLADQMACRLVELIGDTFDHYEAPRGGRHFVGYWSVTIHTGFGALTGALPNGKRRGASLSSGATPVAGVARKGPTAALASTAALPAARIANGIANNHKISRHMLKQPEKRRLLGRMVETYFRRGGIQAQYTIQNRQTLLDAQNNPEAHRDLLVRVSGYTAYFCELNRRMQDEIIARTEDEF